MNRYLARFTRRARADIGVFRAILADPRCPLLARWLLAGAVAYTVSPVDLIPDFIPLLGQLDDLIIVPFMVWLAIRIIPQELITEHRSRNNLRILSS